MHNASSAKQWIIGALAATVAISCFVEAASARVWVGVGVPVGGTAYYPAYAPYPPAYAYPTYYPPYPVYPAPAPAYAPPPVYNPAYNTAPPPVAPQPQQQNVATDTCREYKHSIMIDGEKQDVYGTACKQPDGSWRVVK